MTPLAIAKKRAASALRFDEARAATSSIEARGHGEWSGVPVRWRRARHPSGDLLVELEGALACASGVEDGAGWQIDESGALGVLELSNLEELLVTSAVIDGTWVSETTPLAIELVSDDASGLVFELRAHAEACVPYRLSIDVKSGLPRRLTRVGRDDTWIAYDDFGDGPIARVPRRTIVREAWLEDRFLLDEVVTLASASRRSKPNKAEPAHRFADGVVAGGHLAARRKLPLVRASVDGRDLGSFLLDTGAGSLAIDPALASSLELAGAGRRIVRTSTDVVGATLRRAAELTVGELTMPRPLFLELELDSLSRALGVKLAGVLGYDVFRRATVVIDGDERIELLASAPATAWCPLRFEDRRPVVAVRFPGRDGEKEGLFALDTGSTAAVTIHAGAAPLFATKGGARVSLRGLGGAGSARARSIAWLELAGQRFEDVDVLVAAGGAGVTGEVAAARTGRGVIGSIGMGLLAELTVVLDYAKQRASFTRRKRGAPRARAG